MKRRVAVISSCAPPGPNSPVTGGGLRTDQLVQTLRAAGHSVRLFVERDALGDQAPKILRDHCFDSNSLAGQVRSFRPSILVVEQWALVPLLAEINKPIVVDLHGSLLLENVYRRGDIDLTLDAGSKIQALARADLLLVPAEVQRHHFASWATLAGFDPRELPIALLPLAMPTPPQARKTKKPKLRLVYGGARWPWIDSSSALLTAAEVVASTPEAHLDVFTFAPPRHGLNFEEDLGTWPQVLEQLSGRESERITLHESEPHSDWQRFLREEATVALDLWEPNPERMLAATTRSVEFLWAGLGMVTVTGAAWSEAIARTGAGWTLTPGDQEGLQALLLELASKPPKIAAASQAATNLILEEHQLAQAGRALLRFCETPTRPSRAASTLTESLVKVREEQLAEELRSLQQAHEEEHRELIQSHRSEQREDRARHKGEVDALSEQHRQETDSLVAQHRRESDEDRERHHNEVEQLTAEHREEVSSLVRDNQNEIARLEAQHQDKVRELVKESEAQFKRIAKHANEEAKAAAREHRATMTAATKEHRAAMSTATKEHRKESKELVTQWRTRLKGLEDQLTAQERLRASQLQQRAEQHQAELQAIVTENRTQISALTEEHDQQFKNQAQQHTAALADRDKRAREELEQAVQAHREQVEVLVTENRNQIENLSAERQAEVQRLVGQSRAELEQADERHRAETQARVEEMQQRNAELQGSIDVLKEQLASERRRVKEERTRLEVELRAEMNARELEYGELLERANRSLAEKVREKIGSTNLGSLGSGRLVPAARLARLWAEHAADHAHDEHEE